MSSRRRNPTVFAHRAPMLLLRLVGVLLLRFATRKFDALLLKFPPRITRLEAPSSTPKALHQRPSLPSLPRARGFDPAAKHAADFARLFGEVQVLRFGDEAKVAGEPEEHPRSHQTSRRGCQHCGAVSFV